MVIIHAVTSWYKYNPVKRLFSFSCPLYSCRHSSRCPASFSAVAGLAAILPVGTWHPSICLEREILGTPCDLLHPDPKIRFWCLPTYLCVLSCPLLLQFFAFSPWSGQLFGCHGYQWAMIVSDCERWARARECEYVPAGNPGHLGLVCYGVAPITWLPHRWGFALVTSVPSAAFACLPAGAVCQLRDARPWWSRSCGATASLFASPCNDTCCVCVHQ